MGGEAWIGLAGALGGVLVGGVLSYGVPFIQGRIAARNAEASKLYEQRLSAYVDAMRYTHHVETRVAETTEPPAYRSSRKAMEEIPHEDLITARLRLIAPHEVIQPWTELLDAWEVFSWNMQEEGPQEYGEYYADAGSDDVKRVMTAITAVARSLRRVMGVDE